MWTWKDVSAEREDNSGIYYKRIVFLANKHKDLSMCVFYFKRGETQLILPSLDIRYTQDSCPE